jgi:hypothetical protein
VDNAKRLAFAQMVYDSNHFTSAAPLWAKALANHPHLGDDRQAGAARLRARYPDVVASQSV